MGTFILSDLVPGYLDGGMVKYNSFDDLLAKLDYYLEHEEERTSLSTMGRVLVKPYTYELRMAEMMEAISDG